MEQKLVMKVILKLFLYRLSLCLYDQMRHGTDVSKIIAEVNANQGELSVEDTYMYRVWSI